MGKHERIFIADDDPVLRGILRDRLEYFGHSITAEAGDLEHVKAFVDDPNLKFRVAMLDHRMPENDEGREAAKYIRAKRPEVKIISMSFEPQDYGDLNFKRGDDPKQFTDFIASL